MDFKVAIVGASLSGSACALRLAASGERILLIDRSVFPRRKPCGEGLSHAGMAVLKQLGLAEIVLALPHYEFSGYRLHHVSGRTATVPFAAEASAQGKGIGIQRELLDECLVRRAAQESAVTLRLGENVRVVERIPGGFRLGWGAEQATAEYLVAADGLHSPIGTRLKLPLRHGARQRFGYALSVEGAWRRPCRDVEVAVRPGYEICCTPVTESLVNVSVLADRTALQRLSRQGELSSVALDFLEQAGFSGREVAPPRGVGPFGRHTRSAFADRLFLVGDARESLDPIGGMGMTHALASGVQAGAALERLLREECSMLAAGRSYQSEIEETARQLRGFTRLTYFAVRKVGRSPFMGLLDGSRLAAAIGEHVNAVQQPAILSMICNFALAAAGSF